MKYILNVSIDYSKNYIYTPSFIYDIIKLYQKYFFYFLSLTLFYKRIENNYDRSQFTSDEIIIDNFNHINNLKNKRDINYYISSRLSYNNLKNLIDDISKKTESHIKNIHPEYSSFWFQEIKIIRPVISNLCIIS